MSALLIALVVRTSEAIAVGNGERQQHQAASLASFESAQNRKFDLIPCLPASLRIGSKIFELASETKLGVSLDRARSERYCAAQ